MPVRNQNWYNLQESRRYPLDASATGTGDDGERLPSNLLVDCNIRFPNTAGEYAFLGGITTTPNLVTLTILAADSPTAASSFTPLAVVNIPKPVDIYRHYPITAMQPGVGGWVVFGDGIRDNFAGRFSTPDQSLLMPRVVRRYDPFPIPSLAKLFRDTSLTGLVRIVGGNDIEVVKEEVEIDDELQEALVIRLTQDVDGRNTLAVYVGPCDSRPESENCLKPGIEFVNGVGPDCDGNLVIDFRNVFEAPFESCGGAVLDLALDLDTACLTVGIPAEEDIFTDFCADFVPSIPSVSASSISSVSLSSSSSISVSSVIEPCADLPHIENFDDGVADFFTVDIGTFAFEAGDSPLESLGSSGDSLDSSLSSIFSSSISSVFSSSLSSSSSSESFSSSSSSCRSVSSSSDSSSLSSSSVVVTPIPFLAELCEVTGFLHQANVPFTTKFSTRETFAYSPRVEFGFTTDASFPVQIVYAATNTGLRNVSLLTDCTAVSVPRRCTVDLQLTANGPQRNGGIIINHHLVDPTTSPHIEYFYAEVNDNVKKLRLLRFNGFGFIEEFAGSALPLVVGDWYRLVVDTVLGPGVGQASLSVSLRGITDPGFPSTSFSVITNDYPPPDGKFGVGTDRGYTRFSFFELKEL